MVESEGSVLPVLPLAHVFARVRGSSAEPTALWVMRAAWRAARRRSGKLIRVSVRQSGHVGLLRCISETHDLSFTL